MNGRVTREYLGGGLFGELAAELDAEERAERAAKAERWRAEQRRLDEADKALSDLDESLVLLVTLALVEAGYHHQHKGQ